MQILIVSSVNIGTENRLWKKQKIRVSRLWNTRGEKFDTNRWKEVKQQKSQWIPGFLLALKIIFPLIRIPLSWRRVTGNSPEVYNVLCDVCICICNTRKVSNNFAEELDGFFIPPTVRMGTIWGKTPEKKCDTLCGKSYIVSHRLIEV